MGGRHADSVRTADRERGGKLFRFLKELLSSVSVCLDRNIIRRLWFPAVTCQLSNRSVDRPRRCRPSPSAQT